MANITFYDNTYKKTKKSTDYKKLTEAIEKIDNNVHSFLYSYLLHSKIGKNVRKQLPKENQTNLLLDSMKNELQRLKNSKKEYEEKEETFLRICANSNLSKKQTQQSLGLNVLGDTKWKRILENKEKLKPGNKTLPLETKTLVINWLKQTDELRETVRTVIRKVNGVITYEAITIKCYTNSLEMLYEKFMEENIGTELSLSSFRRIIKKEKWIKRSQKKTDLCEMCLQASKLSKGTLQFLKFHPVLNIFFFYSRKFIQH